MAALWEGFLSAGPGQRTVWLALLLFARSAGLFRLIPVIGGKRVPPTIRFFESLVLAGALLPSLWFVEVSVPASLFEKGAALVSEFLIGLAAGAVPALFFSALTLSGGAVSRMSGFSAAAVLDPELGEENGALETLLYLAALAAFLAAGGLEKFFTAVLTLFETVPPGSFAAPQTAALTLTAVLSQAAALGVQTALPFFAAIAVLWLGSALLARVLPRLHFLTMTMTFSGNLLATLFILHAALGAILFLVEKRLPDWNAFLPTLFSPQ